MYHLVDFLGMESTTIAEPLSMQHLQCEKSIIPTGSTNSASIISTFEATCRASRRPLECDGRRVWALALVRRIAGSPKCKRSATCATISPASLTEWSTQTESDERVVFKLMFAHSLHCSHVDTWILAGDLAMFFLKPQNCLLLRRGLAVPASASPLSCHCTCGWSLHWLPGLQSKACKLNVWSVTSVIDGDKWTIVS